MNRPKRKSPYSRPKSRNLKQRLHRALVGLGMGVALLGSLVYAGHDYWQSQKLVQREARALTKGITASIAQTGLNLDWALGLPFHERVTNAFLFNADGSMHSRYDQGSEPGSKQDAGQPESRWNLSPVEATIQGPAGTLGTLRLICNTAPSSTQLWAYLTGTLGILGIAFALSKSLARRLHRRISSGLLDLTHTANTISANQDYSIRAMVRSNDEVGLLVEIFNHMIEQVQLREQRLSRALKRAEEAKLAKAQFLATMSHEIRTPINGILGMTQLLGDTELRGDQVEFAQTIDQSARGLLGIINDILDFSKGEADCYSLEQIPLSLQDVIKDCLATTGTLAYEKDLELSGFATPGVPHGLLGDPARIRQVILNLISNALKFTHSGHVKVRARLVEDHGAAATVAIEVSDTGIGIPEDRIEKLYKCFSQVDSSNHREFGGTGLGLAISLQIVKAMGGEMTLTTKEGQGSTFGFVVKLPKAKNEDQPVAPCPSGMKLLVIDSSNGIQESLAELLEGNQIQFCSTGIEGRRILLDASQNEFDLILMDSRLSEDMGINKAEHELPFPAIPLVMLSPITQGSSKNQHNWPGRTAQMAKPLNSVDLFWCIDNICAKQPKPRPSLAPQVKDAEEHCLAFSLNVLIVEDHPINQRITMRFLDKLGARHSLANNGREAVEAFQSGVFDVILMDVQMPVMDGIEATRAIRDLERGGRTRIPIVAMTASVLSEDENERQEAGFDDFVPKPMNLQDLRDCLQRWMNSESASRRLAA